MQGRTEAPRHEPDGRGAPATRVWRTRHGAQVPAFIQDPESLTFGEAIRLYGFNEAARMLGESRKSRSLR